jgi:hypothetical protein
MLENACHLDSVSQTDPSFPRVRFQSGGRTSDRSSSRVWTRGSIRISAPCSENSPTIRKGGIAQPSGSLGRGYDSDRPPNVRLERRTDVLSEFDSQSITSRGARSPIDPLLLLGSIQKDHISIDPLWVRPSKQTTSRVRLLKSIIFRS